MIACNLLITIHSHLGRQSRLDCLSRTATTVLGVASPSWRRDNYGYATVFHATALIECLCWTSTASHYAAIHYAVLYRTVLCCTMLHRTVLQCSVIHCTTPLYTTLYCTIVYYTVLHHSVPHCTAQYCHALHSSALYCSALHCTALHCTAQLFDFLRCIQIRIASSSQELNVLLL